MGLTITEELRRGEDASYILNHPLFNEAFNQVKEGLIKALSDSPMGDEKTHNRLAIAIQLLAQIERQFREHINTGKLAAIQTDDNLGKKLRKVAGF